jgi:Ca-activated chloride channel family protein
MRFYPILPIYVVVPVVAIALGLLILFCARKKLRKKKNIRRAVMLLIMAAILARPVFLDGHSMNEMNNLNFYFVVDATNSMSVQDVNGKARYLGVAKDIYDIISSFPGSRYSVIIEDSVVYTAVPMTTSLDFVSSIWSDDMAKGDIKSAKSLVAPKSSDYSSGSDLNSLLDWTSEKVRAYQKNNSARTNIVFFMSDGENNISSVVNSQSKLRGAIEDGAVFGYGSEDGGYIIANGSSDKHEIEYTGYDTSIETSATNCRSGDHCVISKIREDTLQRIAKELDLNYYHREGDGIPREVIDSITEKINYSASDESSDSYRDIYWIFSMILIILLIWDFREVLESVLKEREFKHA